MTYSTNADISGDIKGSPVFSSTTDIRDTDIDNWRSQEYALINSYLSFKYDVPSIAQNSDDMELLKKIEIALVVYRFWCVKNITNLKEVEPKVGVQQVFGYDNYMAAMKWLAGVRDGTTKLNTPQISNNILPLEVQPCDPVLNKERQW